MSNEPMLIAGADAITTWTFTVDASGNIMGIYDANPGEWITVTNASASSFIGPIYALEMSSGDQTIPLLSVDSMQAGKIYRIDPDLDVPALGVEYRIRVDKKLSPDLQDPVGGVLRVGGG